MAELTEEQLLLLDNLMYYQGSADAEGKTVEDICENLLADAQDYNKDTDPQHLFSGGFEDHPEQVQEIARAILEDETLCNLRMEKSIEDTGLRASCFVDQDGDATVAIRGTGGSYEAWRDNVIGEYDHDTYISRNMLNYFNDLDYNNITVTGHSKGGNLAQYVTILSDNDKVDRCVSFDGQGFNRQFIDDHTDQVYAASPKIKSICGDKDYVNILLNTVAGETVYLGTTSGENWHSPYALWKENQGKTDGGIYTGTKDQNPFVKGLESGLDRLVNDGIPLLPDELEHALVNWLAGEVGTIFGKGTGQYTDANKAETQADLDKLLKELKDYLADGLAAAGRYLTELTAKRHKFEVSLTALKAKASELEDTAKQLKQLRNKLSSINLNGSQYGDILGAIRVVEQEIEKQQKLVSKMSEVLYRSHDLYQNAENKIKAS
ncbi:MAG: DUF2974 domain-containing protein [Lachnospiraceae bacterium]|nr:DUF2974 domain-containing protein [Lachnospiraceae bacterium]